MEDLASPGSADTLCGSPDGSDVGATAALARFTPGPWRLTSDAGHPANARVTSTQRRHVAKVYASSLAEDPICEANARLISASPDLYAAAKCALGVLTGNMDGDMDLGDPVEMLRAAIHKASPDGAERVHE